MKFVELLELANYSILIGIIMALVGVAYIVFMVMCNVRTSNPGVVLSRNANSNI